MKPTNDTSDPVWWEAYHGRRYRYLIDTMRDYYEPGDDIAVFGASLETSHIQAAFPSSAVDSYGLPLPPNFPVENLIELDLNKPVRLTKRYGIGVCCEVVEHLNRPVFDVVDDLLRYCKIVVVQTPNSMCLFNRVALALYRSAWQHTTSLANNSEHLYEYTLKELTAGFPVVEIRAKNYFGVRSTTRTLYNLVCDHLPMEFRDGFTVVYSR